MTETGHGQSVRNFYQFGEYKMTEIKPGIFSLLSKAELKELTRCCAIAYPAWSRKSQFETLACQPTAAALFVQHPHFKVTR